MSPLQLDKDALAEAWPHGDSRGDRNVKETKTAEYAEQIKRNAAEYAEYLKRIQSEFGVNIALEADRGILSGSWWRNWGWTKRRNNWTHAERMALLQAFHVGARLVKFRMDDAEKAMQTAKPSPVWTPVDPQPVRDAALLAAIGAGFATLRAGIRTLEILIDPNKERGQ